MAGGGAALSAPTSWLLRTRTNKDMLFMEGFLYQIWSSEPLSNYLFVEKINVVLSNNIEESMG